MLWTILCVCCFIYWWMYRKVSSDEPKTVSWPLFTSLRVFLDKSRDHWDKITFMSDVSVAFDGVSYIYAGFRKVYVVTNPEDADKILRTCLDRDEIYEDQYGPWLGHGFLLASSDSVKIRRKHFGTAMTQRQMNFYLADFNEHARRFADAFASNVDAGPRDLSFTLAEYNLNLMCSTIFGLKTLGKINWYPYWKARKSYLNARTAKLVHLFYHFNIRYGSSQLKKQEDEALGILHRTSDEIIAQEASLYEDKQEECYRKTVLKAAADGVLRQDELREIFHNVIFATHDTTAYSTLYTLVLIGSDQRVQDKIYEEVLKVMSERESEDLTNEDLSKMEYLEAVLKEAVRMFPFIPIQARVIDKELKLKNCTLSANTGCFVLAYGSHRHPSWGADAAAFRPERWLGGGGGGGGGGDALPPMLGFSQGLRNCIGKRYGMVSMKTLLSYLLMKYRFQADYTKMKFNYIGILEPKSGHLITTERR